MQSIIFYQIITIFSKKNVIALLFIIFFIYLSFIINIYPEKENYIYFSDIEKAFNDWNVVYNPKIELICMVTRDENSDFAILNSYFNINKYNLQIPTNQKISTSIYLSKSFLIKLPYNKPFNVIINIINNPNIQLKKISPYLIFYDKYTGIYNDIIFDILNTNKNIIEIDIPESAVSLNFPTDGVRDAYEYTQELYRIIIQSKNKYENDYEKWKINLLVFIIIFSIFIISYCVIFILRRKPFLHFGMIF